MTSIKVMTFNIHSAIGRDGEANAARVADVVAAADIVALQEVDNFWERSGNVSQVALLAERLPGYSSVWQPNIDLFKTAEARRQYGNLLLSRFPILSIKRHSLPKSTQASRLGLQCGVMEAIVAAPFGAVRIYATHVISSDSAAQVRRVMEIYRASMDEGPAISGTHPDATWFEEPKPGPIPQSAMLLGDLNVRPGSDAYRTIQAPPDNPELADAWVVANGDTIGQAEPSAACDAGATYYTDLPARTGERIDYCFVSTEIAHRVVAAEVLGAVDASDHQPLLVTLDADPAGKAGR